MRLILGMLFCLVAGAASAHEYFFAYAEVNYNGTDKKLEITLEGSAHDVEDVLNEIGIPVKELEDHYKDAEMIGKLEKFINSGLVFSSAGNTASLKLMGFEVTPNGMVYFYLQSDIIEITDSLNVRFDWLMDQLEKQQNKITLTYNKQKYTAVFLPGKRSETIKL